MPKRFQSPSGSLNKHHFQCKQCKTNKQKVWSTGSVYWGRTAGSNCRGVLGCTQHAADPAGLVHLALAVTDEKKCSCLKLCFSSFRGLVLEGPPPASRCIAELPTSPHPGSKEVPVPPAVSQSERKDVSVRCFFFYFFFFFFPSSHLQEGTNFVACT